MILHLAKCSLPLQVYRGYLWSHCGTAASRPAWWNTHRPLLDVDWPWRTSTHRGSFILWWSVSPHYVTDCYHGKWPFLSFITFSDMEVDIICNIQSAITWLFCLCAKKYCLVLFVNNFRFQSWGDYILKIRATKLFYRGIGGMAHLSESLSSTKATMSSSWDCRLYCRTINN